MHSVGDFFFQHSWLACSLLPPIRFLISWMLSARTVWDSDWRYLHVDVIGFWTAQRQLGFPSRQKCQSAFRRVSCWLICQWSEEVSPISLLVTIYCTLVALNEPLLAISDNPVGKRAYNNVLVKFGGHRHR